MAFPRGKVRTLKNIQSTNQPSSGSFGISQSVKYKSKTRTVIVSKTVLK